MTSALMMSCGKKSVIDRSQGVDPATELKALVAEHIQDPGTRTQIIDILNKGDARLQEFYEFYEQHAKRLDALSSDYNTTRADFDKATLDFNARYREVLMGIVADRFAIKELTTREEWALIAARERSFLID
jgi:hypothetical protein